LDKIENRIRKENKKLQTNVIKKINPRIPTRMVELSHFTRNTNLLIYIQLEILLTTNNEKNEINVAIPNYNEFK